MHLRTALVAGGVAALIAMQVIARRATLANAAAVDQWSDESATPFYWGGFGAGPAPELEESIDPQPAPFYWGSLDLWGITEEAIEERQVTNALQEGGAGGANVKAFLAMIAASEGTNRGPDPYRICYGYRHTIRDFADHPAITREWKGESIANLGPQYVGKVSTAAGRYQIIKPTWVECKRVLDLTDFSPESQDAAAVYLIKRRGALDLVKAGRLEAAITLCRKEWASLPGAGYGQPERKLASLVDAYEDAGGHVA